MKTPETIASYNLDQQGNLFVERDREIWLPLDHYHGKFVVSSVDLIIARRLNQQLIAGTLNDRLPIMRKSRAK